MFSLLKMFVLPLYELRFLLIPACERRVSLEGRERPKVSAGRPHQNPWLHVIYSTFWQAHMKNPAAVLVVVLSMRKFQYQTNNHTSCRNTNICGRFEKKIK